jgi:hypothetical protein
MTSDGSRAIRAATGFAVRPGGLTSVCGTGLEGGGHSGWTVSAALRSGPPHPTTRVRGAKSGDAEVGPDVWTVACPCRRRPLQTTFNFLRQHHADPALRIATIYPPMQILRGAGATPNSESLQFLALSTG